jgi:hypothetical protein
MRLGTCPGDCGAARAKDEELAYLRERVIELQRELVAIASTSAYRAVHGQQEGPPRPRPRPETPLVPWIQSAVGGGHVDIHAERERIEKDWKRDNQPAAAAVAEG